MGKKLAANPVKAFISKELKFSAFTDNLNDSGFIDFDKALPAGAVVIGSKVDVTQAFIGDTSADVFVGTAGDLKKFSGDGTTAWADDQLIYRYDFAIDGGAISAITLRSEDGRQIPLGAYITDALICIETGFTTGTAATASLGTEGAADVQAATVVSGAPYSTTGGKRGSALTATSAAVKTTALRDLVMTVATGTITAGKMKVILNFKRPLPSTSVSAFAVAKKYMSANPRGSFVAAATTPRVTLRSATDFTLVSAGKMRVTLFYLDPDSKFI